ncbi:NAD(P)-dependent oxidoreductase [Actinoplanes solisilvae]|uniref:NAD(P)-dependent oxidoreductase n=1 Tax=Actinoplanes solisilvae TaxID=2486853 RepID=UPI0013E2D658|nr:NAD(P)-dependent oxidoreductase [Actinoplanes solisilvae]
MTDETRVAVLGLGIMGSAMAHNLVAAGLPTTVWNRTPAATVPLARAGAAVAASAAEAVSRADVVITMLPTAEAVEEVMFGQEAVVVLPPGSVWAQMGTIGTFATGSLERRVPEGVLFVDAPVSGSSGPAKAGQLLILAGGPDEAKPIVAPVFAAIGRDTLWLGPAGRGSALKLAVNAYMAFLVEGVAESLRLTTELGLDPRDLDRAIEGGPLDAPFADAKLHKIERGDRTAEFPLEWALKDVNLALAAAGADRFPLLGALSRQWGAEVDAGHGREDVSWRSSSPTG